ncbi:MAG TPA: sigma-70 family RNA polymerase sigma factor [Thermoanaerobaculia bacterium]|nr:sigma-70 family RNA polymerase sigma factor [Thermoanaerobaculia bacterium]
MEPGSRTSEAPLVQPLDTDASDATFQPSLTTGLRAYATRRLRNRAAGEDVCQEALRVGVEALAAGRIESPEALPGFLFRAAANLCMHVGRSAARESRALQRLASDELGQAERGGDPLDSLISAETRARVLRALARIDPTERQLLGMTFRDDLSSERIGRRLGITPGAVRVRRHRALRRLAALLGRTTPPVTRDLKREVSPRAASRRPGGRPGSRGGTPMNARATASHGTRLRRILPFALLALLGTAPAGAQDVRQFPAHQPHDIAPGPDGAMWYAEGPFRKIGRIDGSGAVTEFPVEQETRSIAPGSDGNLWFTTETAIGRMTPSGALAWYPVSSALQIVSAPDGSLWFSTWRFSDEATSIGRLTTAGTITEFPMFAGSPTFDATWDPCPDVYVVAGALDGGAWFARPCAGKLGRVTASGTIAEFALSGSSNPRRIAVGPDGNLWFTEDTERVGRITPGGDITEFPLPGGAHGIVGAADGNLWAAGPGRLSRITTGGAITQYPVPIDTETPGIAAGLDGTLWIADKDSGRIVRFAPEPDTAACAADAETLCLDGGRFRVTTEWTSDASSGRGRAVNLSPDSGYFWFFDPANLEVVVKVLNGCAANGHHWAFAAGLTNVEVRTTVRDTFSGTSRTYTNPRGAPFAPIQDTKTFAACR